MTEKELEKEYRKKNIPIYAAKICTALAVIAAGICTVITYEVVLLVITGIAFIINLVIYITDELKKSEYIADNIYRKDEDK